MTDKLARGIWPALCTGFDDQAEHVDADRVRALVRTLIEAGSNGFFVCGGTGEGRVMSVPERMSMAEIVADEVAGAIPLILQVGGTTTEDAVELAQHAAHLQGIDAVASVAPVERPNDLAAAVDHYAAIGGASKLPFYVYWLMGEADQRITADGFLDAMKAVPNFTGVKFTDNNLYLFGQLIERSGGSINAISGPDEMALPAMVMGAEAAIGTTYNIMPRLYLQMRAAFEDGRLAEAMQCQRRANQVIRILIQHGVLASVKVMLGWRGTPVGPPRLVEPLTAAAEKALRQDIEALDFEVA